ncbi:MAG: penicillin-binding protein 1A [Thermoanaerobaculia bacterium]
MLAGVLVGVAFAAAIRVPKVDQLDEQTLGQVTRLFDRDGELLTSYARERRILLREGEIPEVLQQAVIAAEDRNFFQHGGVDAVGVVRASIANLRSGGRSQGASTLTMQLARGLFLSRQKTWRRKIEEAFLAVELEKTYTKQQILTLYCNLVFVGEGNYGMQAASRYYFGKDVADITVPEAATLAGIVQRPSVYSPYDNPELVVERRGYVLRSMHEEGYIDEERLRKAMDAPLDVVERRFDDEGPAAYFAEEVRQRLVEEFGSDAVLERGFQVRTTLDRRMQETAHDALRHGLARLDHRRGWRGSIDHLEPAAVEARTRDALPADLSRGRWQQGVVLTTSSAGADVQIDDRRLRLTAEGTEWTGRRPDQLLKPGDVAWFRLEPPAEEGGSAVLMLEQLPEHQGAVLILENATGAVRAMVGGWDFDQTKFNRATQARRQVGSAFKPLVYGAALEAGFTPADTLLDAPVAFRGTTADEPYTPRNYDKHFRGILTLQHALENSINVPAVKLLDLVGVQRVIDLARRGGITERLPPYPSLALGSADVTPLEMATAYASFANQGVYVRPYLIELVVDPAGNELQRHHADVRQMTSPQVAAVLVHMMEGTIDRGTGRRAGRLPLALAGKSGTTNDYSDAWFIGFTPTHTVLVWVGYDTKRTLGDGMTGSAAALPIWIEVLETGLEEGWIEEGGAFPDPPGVVRRAVDARSGLLAGEGSGGLVEMSFVEGSEPTRSIDPAWSRVLSLPWFQQMSFYIPKRGERMPGVGAPAADSATAPETGG